MNFFQHRYYRLNKILMTLIGQWPYQSTSAKCGFIVAFLSVGVVQLVPMLTALVKYRDDENVLLDGALALLFGAVSVTKLIGFLWNSKKTLMLINRIRTDWYEWARDREVNILHRYAEQKRKMTTAYLCKLCVIRITHIAVTPVYLVMNFINHTVFMAQPMIPKMIDLLLKNGTEPGRFAYPVDVYHLDMQKYHFYIIVFMYFCVSMSTIIVAINGAMLICYVHHACGIFTALGHKLEQLGNNRTSVQTRETRDALDKKDTVLITLCINRHNDAIVYVNLIVASYSWTFFFTIGFGVILFNITGLQVLLRTNDLKSTIKYVLYALSVTLYFYIDCYMCQTMTDHSISLSFYIYNNQWYKLSREAQKLLQFMAMRCKVPCELTAGNMLVMSMRSFWLTVKTAISYLMLLHSLHGL